MNPLYRAIPERGWPMLASALNWSAGAKAPGLTQEYAASTSANVLSTAGDAALSVSDTTRPPPARLSNGAFSLAEPLRTGTYSRTLTFTLSTTSP